MVSSSTCLNPRHSKTSTNNKHTTINKPNTNQTIACNKTKPVLPPDLRYINALQQEEEDHHVAEDIDQLVKSAEVKAKEESESVWWVIDGGLAGQGTCVFAGFYIGYASIDL